jgi:hypothetical protein
MEKRNNNLTELNERTTHILYTDSDVAAILMLPTKMVQKLVLQ